MVVSPISVEPSCRRGLTGGIHFTGGHERWNQHLYDRGGMRRVHLRGRENILKRLVVHSGAANLGLLMRALFGKGTPRGLQGCLYVLLLPPNAVSRLFSRTATLVRKFRQGMALPPMIQMISAAA